jgi:GTP-binding protein
MPIPRVAIVGRPNVGKSSIFNWIAGRRLAIVEDSPGVTRDRLTTLIEHRGHHFEMIDTGGMGIEDVDNLTEEIESQIEQAIEDADVLLFVVDTRSGMVPLDQEVAERLRKVDKPILLVANKTDSPTLDSNADEFHRLGRGWLTRVSVQQNRNKDELLDLIVQRIPQLDSMPEEVEPPMMKIAIVGRRNVGKSTFVNTLAQTDRCIVSEVAGTTRDSVDVMFQMDGHKFMAIDTPGLRRNKSVRTDIDWYGMHRAQRSIRRADVVLMFFDSMQQMSKVDKQLAHYISDNFKPCIFVVNKWDLLAGQLPTERWVRYVRETFPTMTYCPIGFITGQTGKNVKTLLNHAQMLFKQANERISTGQLNRLVKAAIERHEPPLYQLKRPKIYYATQISSLPPTIILVCNQPQGFPPTYQRYLLSFLRDHLPFGEIPIKLYLQPRARDDERDDLGKDERTPKSAANDPNRAGTAEEGYEAAFDEEEFEDDDEFDAEGDDVIEMEFEDEVDGEFDEEEFEGDELEVDELDEESDENEPDEGEPLEDELDEEELDESTTVSEKQGHDSEGDAETKKG